LNSSTALQISLNRANTTDAAVASSVFGGTGTLVGTGTGVTNFTNQLTSAALEKRISVARVFQASLEQVDNLTNDATFGGNNLLNSAGGFNVDLSDATSAPTASTFQVKLSSATDAVSLGFAAKVGGVYQDGAQLNFNTNALVNGALVKTQSALARLEGRQVEIDSLTDSLKTRSDFNNTVKSSLGSASNDLTALDQAEATAQAQAVSFGNSVATKFLGTIAQRSQQLLQLF
jgi:flagellin-like hook-associated protein FlgL